MTDEKLPLRSREWFGKNDKDSFIHRSWMRNQGIPSRMFDGRPVIGICNTWSELTPCNAHFRTIAEHVRRGVIEAGGFPLEFPVTSPGESNIRPTAMFLRNLVSMDVEESIRGNPLDGVVLLCGCDKTTPGLVMGAASVDLPTIVVSGGPMLSGHYRGRQIGSGTAVWQLSEEVKSGKITASTMASMAEALGIALPHNAAIPAPDSRRLVLANSAGMRIVEMVREDLRLSKVLTRAAFENAVRVNGAIGGSTNAVVHLLAIAGRVGIDLSLDDWDHLGRNIPTILNLQPSGKYLMEDFYYAGGLPSVMRRLAEAGFLHRDALTVTGQTAWENVANAETWNDDVIKPMDAPLVGSGGIAVLRGNLAPNGCIIKPSAASAHLMLHRGRAVVFENIEDYHDKINNEELDIDETCIMVLKNCGPTGYPGFAEVGNMGLPPKVLRRGIRDMIRISDGRMSGTAYGTVILHTAPEAAKGGPLAVVMNGDMIEVDVAARRVHLDISDTELSRRLSNWVPPPPHAESGYTKLYIDHVTQADRGADFDILVGMRGSAVPRESH